MSIPVGLSSISYQEQNKKYISWTGNAENRQCSWHMNGPTVVISVAEANDALSKLEKHESHAVLLDSPDRGAKPFSRSRDACTKVRIWLQVTDLNKIKI